jgi:hypothetical protein
MTDPFGGIPVAPLNAPPPGEVVAGLQPGSLPGIIRANIVIIFGPSNGLFVYSGTPGAGTLIASIAATAGTDPYGNKYPAGISSQSGGIEAILTGNELAWDAPADHPQNLPAIFAAPSAAIGDSLEITSGIGSAGNTAAALTLYDSEASSTVPAIPSGGPGIFVAGGCPLVTDQWHTLGTLAGTTLTQAAYRMTVEGELEIDFHGSTGGANAASVNFSVTLPAAYRPSTTSRRQPIHTGRAVTAGETFPYVQVSTAGTVQVNFNAANINVTFDVNCHIRLSGSP